MFHNDILNELNDAFPAGNQKVKLVMLFALLDGLYDPDLDRHEYIEDLRTFLGIDIEADFL